VELGFHPLPLRLGLLVALPDAPACDELADHWKVVRQQATALHAHRISAGAEPTRETQNRRQAYTCVDAGQQGRDQVDAAAEDTAAAWVGAIVDPFLHL